MQLSAVVCENGLGHFKRTLGILHEWHQRFPEDIIHLFVEQWQVERLADWDKIQLLEAPQVHVHTGYVAPGIRLGDVTALTDGRLLNWIKRLEGHPAIRQADLVLSDNLSGLLTLRPDTIMLGSFLWSDVFECLGKEMDCINQFVSEERRLLRLYKPPMICVADIAMPGVLEQTKAVKMPWFAQEPRASRESKAFSKKVAILGGATGLMDDAIKDLAEKLAAHEDWELMLPPNILSSFGLNAGVFGFEQADFLAVDLVICRPGIGTITDCINSQTPMITFSENGNPEMDHNSMVLEQMGVALIVRDGAELIPTLLEISQPEIYQNMLHKLSQLETTGIRDAVDWLISYQSLKES
ncbi:MAG: hypothetical protein KDC34_03980 [Saprospiraceae bacterium]|nr:hypothetical protein [Saprospiraceae bacterium]